MQKLKLKPIIIPLIAVAFLTNCNSDVPPTPPVPTTFTVSTDSPGVRLDSGTATTGEDYLGTIIVTAPDKILSSRLDSVILQDEASTRITDYTYTLEEGNKTAKLKIPASDIVNDIKVSVILEDTPADLYTIFTETKGVKIEPSFATEKEDYEGTISSESDKLLRDHLDAVVLDDDKSTPITDYTYTLAEDAKTATLLIPAHNITNNIKVKLTLVDPPVPPKWLVSFNPDGGTFVASQKVSDGDYAEKPKIDPSKEGYIFNGWYAKDARQSFDFDHTAIKGDIILKAKWKSPTPTSYHFKFNGIDCFIGGTDRYETEILAGVQTQFAIVPKTGCLLPPDDDSYFEITTVKPENITYDPTTGVISISRMEADIEIVAIAPKENSYTFDFQGTNCTINNVAHYTKRWLNAGSNLSFTILPAKGHVLPTFGILEEIELIGDNVTYDDETGIITVTNMSSDVTVIANAPMNTKVVYTISFDSRYFKANTINDPATAYNQFVAKRDSDADSLKLYIFPEETFALPESITVTFDDGPTAENDYYYDKDEQIVIIYRKADALISMESTEIKYCITFDAGSGIFKSTDAKTISFHIKEGINIAAFIRFIIQPTLKDNTFAYYTYDDGSTISYSDTLTHDTKLKANYFNITAPYANLDSLDWSIIKQVSVTNSNPKQCFQIGATKKVIINNKIHTVKIIGFNHDRLLAKSQNAGITFDFANVISDANGNGISTEWRMDCCNYDYTRGVLYDLLKKDGGIYNLLPADIKNVMETVIKKVCKSEGRGEPYFAEFFETELFPLSVYEFSELSRPEAENEGTKYEYYELHEGNEYMKRTDCNGNYSIYWYRSPVATVFTATYRCMENGSLGSDGTNRRYAVAPAFCL